MVKEPVIVESGVKVMVVAGETSPALLVVVIWSVVLPAVLDQVTLLEAGLPVTVPEV